MSEPQTLSETVPGNVYLRLLGFTFNWVEGKVSSSGPSLGKEEPELEPGFGSEPKANTQLGVTLETTR